MIGLGCPYIRGPAQMVSCRSFGAAGTAKISPAPMLAREWIQGAHPSFAAGARRADGVRRAEGGQSPAGGECPISEESAASRDPSVCAASGKCAVRPLRPSAPAPINFNLRIHYFLKEKRFCRLWFFPAGTEKNNHKFQFWKGPRFSKLKFLVVFFCTRWKKPPQKICCYSIHIIVSLHTVTLRILF